MTQPKCSTWEESTSSLIRKMERSGAYTPASIRFYKYQCQIVGKRLIAVHGEDYCPRKVTKTHIVSLMESMREEGLCITTQRGYVMALKKLCQHCNNHVFDGMMIGWSADTRQHVDWLDKDQATRLLDAPMDSREDMVVTLMLCMGLRRIEVIRLNVQDIGDGWITVNGKGRLGGKLRTVPFHPRFVKVLDRWLKKRRDILGDDSEDALILYRSGRKVSRYSLNGSAIDQMVRTVGYRAGIDVSCHTLRRTFGRLLWRAGVNIETIARIYGHTSTIQTLRYIGVNMDDMESAIKRLTF